MVWSIYPDELRQTYPDSKKESTQETIEPVESDIIPDINLGISYIKRHSI